MHWNNKRAFVISSLNIQSWSQDLTKAARELESMHTDTASATIAKTTRGVSLV